MNLSLLKKCTIYGGYGLALVCCLLAFPQYKTQTEDTISQTLDSVDRALNDPNAPAEIDIAATQARHPFAGFLVRASVWFAIIGTGGVVWSLFGKEENQQPTVIAPPFLLPAGSNTSAPTLPYPISQSPLPVPQTERSVVTPPVTPSPRPPVATPPASHWDFEQRRLQLFQYLANSPQAWILQLLEATPLFIWGEQRSGKTELAQIIAILRRIFMFHAVEISDPHGHLNEWLPCFPIYGSDFDYEAIDERLIAYKQRLKGSLNAKQPITTIWDEYTQYAENCTCQKTKQFDFIKSVVSESQKKEEFPIIMSHGRTNDAKGGTTNTHEMFENGFIQIHLLAKRSTTGRAMPSGRGFLKGLSKDANGKPEQFAIELPPWLRAAALYQYFPEISNPAPSTQQHYAPPTPFYPPAASPTANYKVFATQLDNLMDSPALPNHLQGILDLARERGEPIKARDVQRAPMTALRNLDAETIRSAFRELASLGKGHCEGEGQNLSFVTQDENSN